MKNYKFLLIILVAFSVGLITIISNADDVFSTTSFDGSDNGIESVSELEDHFGASLAAGNFDGDYYVDLAVGVPDKDINSIEDVGAVNVIYGSSSGLTSDGAQAFYQLDIGGNSEWFDHFGTTLAAGDFDNDGYDDLAVGVPDEDVFLNGINIYDAGVVNVIYGSSSGLTSDGAQIWYQSIIGGSSEQGDNFGTSLTVGDFNDDGYVDLAVGAPNEDVYSYGYNELDVGIVHIIFGSASGLTSAGAEIWHQDILGILDHNGIDDNFGASLAAGNFNGDFIHSYPQYDDLAVGVPNEDIISYSDSDEGAVNAMRGGSDGLYSWRNVFLYQDLL